MERLNKNFDANSGINWESIRNAAADEAIAMERDIERGCDIPGMENMKTKEKGVKFDMGVIYVIDEQRKRLDRLSSINDMQEHGSVNLPKCVLEFAKSFTQEKLEGLQRILSPSGSKADDTRKLFEAASRMATFQLICSDKFPPKEVVSVLMEYSPMEGLADTRISFDKRMQTAMGIILEAQRFDKKVNVPDMEKPAEASL